MSKVTGLYVNLFKWDFIGQKSSLGYLVEQLTKLFSIYHLPLKMAFDGEAKTPGFTDMRPYPNSQDNAHSNNSVYSV